MTPAAPDALRRAAPWALAWLLLTALLLLLDMGSGLGVTDQAWFQEVLKRVLGGDDLYGQVFFGVPPLSVWATLPAAKAFGADPVVVKGTCAAAAAATALVAASLAGRLGIGPGGRALVGLASLAYLTLPSFTLYNPLASLFALLTLAAAIGWLDRVPGKARALGEGRRASQALIAGGIAAGLSLTAKHTVGLGALAALALVVALLGPRPRLDLRGRGGDLALVLGSALAVVAIVMAPVAISGSLGDFTAHALEKGEYMRSASISYLDGLDVLWQMLGRPFDSPRLLLVQLVFLVPALALASLALAWRTDPERAVALALFLLAALVAALPRAAVYHVAFVVPVAAVCIAWSISAVAARASRRALAAVLASLAVLLGATAAVTLFEPSLEALDRGDDPSQVEGLAGPLASQETQDALETLGAGLAAADRGEGTTFVLSPTAGAAYLVSGIANPTRFDYPVNTEIRASDSDLIASIERGEIERVCLSSFVLGFEPFAPERLIAYVRERMSPAGTIGDRVEQPVLSCELYERRSRPAS